MPSLGVLPLFYVYLKERKWLMFCLGVLVGGILAAVLAFLAIEVFGWVYWS